MSDGYLIAINKVSIFIPIFNLLFLKKHQTHVLRNTSVAIHEHSDGGKRSGVNTDSQNNSERFFEKQSVHFRVPINDM
jgi:hypothetical protein